MRCDLLVIGDTPDAWSAAEHAASLGARCLVIRPENDSCRRAAGLAAVLAACEGDGEALWARKPTCGPMRPCDLWHAAIGAHERRVAESRRNWGIRARRGSARLTGSNSVKLFAHGAASHIEAGLIVIATGTAAGRRSEQTSHPGKLFQSEDTPDCREAPRRLAVLGGNRTARAFARLFQLAGSEVTLVDSPGSAILARDVRTKYDDVVDWRADRDVSVRLASGRSLETDATLFAANRLGATTMLNLAAAGLESDERGRLWCDDRAMTWVPTIAGAGEVIGYPHGLADDQTRLHETIGEQLDLATAPLPDTISFHRATATRSPILRPAISRVRAKPRPALRVFNGV